ncbi:MAG TPA: tetratricopeptide repeat protein [Bryobacteraceae bacterium]|jgi:tetratricopeptide (TPR) repeat protein|nr:tetratricopeptide repeat protein [Bryobacteraceae bacterium]
MLQLRPIGRWKTVVVFLTLLLAISCSQSKDRARAGALARGRQYYGNGDFRSAEIQFERAIQTDPGFGEGWLWLGRAQERLGSTKPALDALKEAVKLMPGQDSPLIELGNFLLVGYVANPRHPADVYKQISAIADQLLGKNADSFEGIKFRGFLATTENDPATAVSLLSKANRLKAGDAGVVTALFENLVRSGQKEQAETIALDFLRRRPDYGPLYTMLSQYYLQAGRKADAEEILKKKVERNPKNGLYRVELARFYSRAGQTARAQSVLDTMTGDPRNFPQGYLDAGDYYLEGRNWQEARREYALGAQNDRKSGTIYLKRLMRVALAMNDRPAAEQLVEQILKRQPDDRDAQAARADLEMASTDPSKRTLAIAEFKKLVDAAPDNAGYHYQYAEALRLNGQNDLARPQYLATIQSQPANLPALESLADLSIRGQSIDEALRYADRVLSLDPGNVRMSLVKSAALAAKGRFDDTRSILYALQKQHPDLREAQLQLALLDVEEKHYPEAEARFRKYYVPGKGDIRSLEGLVAVYRAQKRLDQAVVLVKQDLEKGPQYDQVRQLLARVAAETGKYDLAVEQYRLLARSQPGAPAIAVQLGLACQAKGDRECAISEFERARKLAPGNAAVWGFLGRALEDSGRKPEAIASYQQSLQLDQRNPWVKNNLAYLIADSAGDLNEALKLAGDAVRQNPGNAAFNDTLGWVYLKKRDFPSAIHTFEGARDRSPETVDYRIHLGQALLASGNRDRARSELEIALRLPSTPLERREIQDLLEGHTKRDR